MRLLINFNSDTHLKENYFNKYFFQSAIYSFLIGTEFEHIHNTKKFKYFTFSDFFPSGDLKPGEIKSIIISSPNKSFIETLYDRFIEKGYFYLLDKRLEIESLKTYEIKYTPKSFITGSPIVIQIDNRINKYFSFRNNGTVTLFLKKIKENAIKKYIQYYGLENFEFNDFIFDSLMFKKEVAVKLIKNGIEFLIIGSTWYYLNKNNIPSKFLKFYKFIMDAGLGEKNSLGFGFLNPRRKDT